MFKNNTYHISTCSVSYQTHIKPILKVNLGIGNIKINKHTHHVNFTVQLGTEFSYPDNGSKLVLNNYTGIYEFSNINSFIRFNKTTYGFRSPKVIFKPRKVSLNEKS